LSSPPEALKKYAGLIRLTARVVQGEVVEVTEVTEVTEATEVTVAVVVEAGAPVVAPSRVSVVVVGAMVGEVVGTVASPAAVAHAVTSRRAETTVTSLPTP